MTISNPKYQKSKDLEDILIKIRASHQGTKKTLGIISSSDKTSQNVLQERDYSKVIKIDLKNNPNELDNAQFVKSLDDEKFDAIYIGDILHHAKDPDNILNQLSFHLNENGSLTGYLHNISHISSRIRLLDGDFSTEKIGLDEYALHHYTIDSLLILFASADYSLNNLYKINDEVDLKRTDLFHYKFPQDLLESILADSESATLYYVYEASPKSKIDKSARRWTNQFSRNLVTERLDSIIESYKKIISEKSSIIDYYQKVIKDKQIDVQNIEKSNAYVGPENKESHLLQVIEQKDILAKGLVESIEQKEQYIKDLTKTVAEKDSYIKDLTKTVAEKDSYIKELQEILRVRSNELVKIYNSFTWKFLRKLEKISRK